MAMIKKRMLCKRAWLVAFALIVSVLVSACSSGNNAGENEAGSSVTNGNVSEESTDSNSYEEEYISRYTYCWDYTNEYAWVSYYGESENYLAVIDKNGQMKYKYDTELLSGFTTSEAVAMVTCQDGYLYFEPEYGSDELIVLSPAGIAVKYEFNDSDLESGILAYGDGYVITWSSYSDFDSEGHVYALYDSEGSIVNQAKLEEDLYEGPSFSASYCGNDIFCVKINGTVGQDSFGNNQFYCKFYNVAGDELASIKYTSGEDFIGDGSFADGETVMYLGLDGTVTEDYWGEVSKSYELLFMDVEGNISRISSDYSVGEFTPVVSDNKCFYIGYDSSTGEYHYMVYDLETETFSELYPENEDRINLNMYESAPVLASGRLVIPLTGQDGNSYIEVIDEESNLLMEPTLADEFYGFTDGMLVIKSDGEYSVYDTDLNLVYSLSDTEYDSMREYSNGAAYVTGEKTMPAYLDTDGNLIFEEVTAVNVEEIYATTITLSDVNADNAEEYTISENETDNDRDTEGQAEFEGGEEWSEESSDEDAFDEEWYKKNTYTDEDGNTMSFGWLDDGSFEIEFEWGVYSAYDLDSSGYTPTEEGYYRYNGNGYCIEYDVENNAVLFVPGAGGSVWYYAD